ncbi:MAG: DUF3047 domain-containing protein [Nitrospinota bacterium]
MIRISRRFFREQPPPKANPARRSVWAGLFLLVFLIGGIPPAVGQEADRVIVDGWPEPVGDKGVPKGWNLKEYKGSVAPGDIAVESVGGQSVLHLKAGKKSYFIGLEKLEISVSKTPILTWRWKTQRLLKGADARKEDADDQPVNLYVTFHPGKDGKVRAIGYLWDVGAPRCTYISAPGERSWWKRKILRAAGIPVTWYVILRNGGTPLGTWFSEARDVAADYRTLFGTDSVPDVQSVAVQIDSATLGGQAESWVGPIRFVADRPPSKNTKPGAEPACEALRPAPAP